MFFTLKATYTLKIFKYLFLIFGHAEKRLDYEKKLISKFMTSYPGKKNN